jgi:hypothetical protein
MEVSHAVIPAQRVPSGSSGLLGFDLVGDDFAPLPIRFFMVPHVLALGQQSLFVSGQPNAKVRVTVNIIGFVAIY